jgi:hypothetical protein
LPEGGQPVLVGRGSAMLTGLFTASWIIAGLAVLATVGCLLTIPALGWAPGNPWAGSILYILAPGLLIPFFLFMFSRAATHWLDPNGEWFRPTGTQLALRVVMSLAFVLVGLAALMAGLAPFEDFMPGSWDRAGDLFVGAFAGLIFLAILISGVAGAAIVGGWKGVPAGLLLAAGFGALCFSALAREPGWDVAAYTLLAASVAWFYAIGVETGWLTDFHHGVMGHWLTGVLGAAAVATMFWWGPHAFALAGLCVLAGWIPLQLPRTTGQATPVARRPRPDKPSGRALERKQYAAGARERKRRARQDRTRRQRS